MHDDRPPRPAGLDAPLISVPKGSESILDSRGSYNQAARSILVAKRIANKEIVMAVPSQYEMNLIVLELMTDGEQRTRSQAKAAVRKSLQMSAEDMELTTSSGVLVYESRVGWAISYLSRAAMLNAVKRGVYEITDFGRSCVQDYSDGKAFTHFLNKTIAETNPWNTSSDKKNQDSQGDAVVEEPIEQDEETSPQEQIDEAFAKLNDELQQNLLQSILDKDPAFFERLVVELLVKMGYGQGQQTPISHDSGIDGMVATDALGFDPIYVQAKRYAPGNSVGRPELQAFAGALGSISRGAFITTSSFAKSAVEWVSHYPHATIVLIDGKRLTELMIQYDLGVSTERVYRIKRLDGDFFGDE